MKNTSHILELNRRHESDPRNSRGDRNFPLTDQNYQSSKLHGGCGTPVKFHHPAFFEISNEYDDLVGEVRWELYMAMRRALVRGVPEEAIALDPGVGFSKRPIHSVGVF